jgi:GNAT superfamily N-acetyltransferase
VRWRPLALERFEEELRAIYHLSCKSFVDNFLFTPLSEAEFMANYRAVRPHLHAELVLMAECASELIGYLFAIPDLNQRLRGEAIDTCIVKTLAVVPGRRWAGLGSVLVAECHRIARQLGFRRAIHAPMHDSNRSRSISAHYSQTMRGYTLFHHRLHSGR